MNTAETTAQRRGWKKWKNLVWAVIGVIVLTLVGLSMRPRPLRVETQVASRGPMRVTVDGQGKTRVRARYQVFAPATGRMGRIELREGDRVEEAGVITRIEPVDSPLLDVRSRTEAQARVGAAQAALDRGHAAVEAAKTAMEFAQKEFDRRKELFAKGAAARAEFDAAELALRSRTRELEATKFAAEADRFQLETARATLGSPSGGRGGVQIEVRAPVAGSVLRVLRDSAGVVAAGTPLVEIGDVSQLEVVVDLLTTDAVQVEPGNEASVEQWGGHSAIGARVRRVEPSAFTKVSALGVEEQRVNVILDLAGPTAPVAPVATAGAGATTAAAATAGSDREALPAVPALGDGFQSEVRIVVWRSPSVLKVPVSALFRAGERWAVYVVEGGKAQQRLVEVGHRDGSEAEISSGLTDGARVILHPGDQLHEGTAVEYGAAATSAAAATGSTGTTGAAAPTGATAGH